MRVLSDSRARFGVLEWTLSALIVTFVGLAIWPRLAGGDPSPANHCISNLKVVSVALSIYRQDNDDCLPTGDWCARVRSGVYANSFDCPEVGHYGYAMNVAVVGTKAKALNQETTVMLFETDALGESVIMNLEGRSTTRHNGMPVEAFLDTHVRRIPKP